MLSRLAKGIFARIGAFLATLALAGFVAPPIGVAFVPAPTAIHCLVQTEHKAPPDRSAVPTSASHSSHVDIAKHSGDIRPQIPLLRHVRRNGARSRFLHGNAVLDRSFRLDFHRGQVFTPSRWISQFGLRSTVCHSSSARAEFEPGPHSRGQTRIDLTNENLRRRAFRAFAAHREGRFPPLGSTLPAPAPQRHGSFVKSRRGVMRLSICLMAAIIVLTGLAAIELTPVRASMTRPDLQVHANASLTYVHCRRVYHCYWTDKATEGIADAMRLRRPTGPKTALSSSDGFGLRTSPHRTHDAACPRPQLVVIVLRPPRRRPRRGVSSL